MRWSFLVPQPCFDPLGHIWYDVLLFNFLYGCSFNLILYQTLGLKLIAHFVSMHVGMD